MHAKAFGRPRSVIDWAEWVIVGGLTLAFLYMAVGRDKAREEAVKSAIYLLAVLLASVVFGAIRIWQASWQVHRENLASIASIERRRDELAATLSEERMAQAAPLASTPEGVSSADRQRQCVPMP